MDSLTVEELLQALINENGFKILEYVIVPSTTQDGEECTECIIKYTLPYKKTYAGQQKLLKILEERVDCQ